LYFFILKINALRIPSVLQANKVNLDLTCIERGASKSKISQTLSASNPEGVNRTFFPTKISSQQNQNIFGHQSTSNHGQILTISSSHFAAEKTQNQIKSICLVECRSALAAS
jgi:hypothetical protein